LEGNSSSFGLYLFFEKRLKPGGLETGSNQGIPGYDYEASIFIRMNLDHINPVIIVRSVYSEG